MQAHGKYPNRIREIRNELNWTQDQLAEACDTSYQQISRLERAERRLNDAWLTKLSKATGRPKAAFLVDVGFPGAPPSQGDLVKGAIESRLIEFWRQLENREQDIILALVDGWARRRNGDEPKN